MFLGYQGYHSYGDPNVSPSRWDEDAQTHPSRGLPDKVSGDLNYQTKTGSIYTITSVVTHSYGLMAYSSYPDAINVKLVSETLHDVEDPKAGFVGKPNKDAVEQLLQSNNRYLSNSNIFTQTFLGK